MSDEHLTPEQENEALAAEFALGLLEPDEAEAVHQRMVNDPVFASAVRDWQERFSAMADELTAVMPPARAMLNIQRALGLVDEPLSKVPEIRRGRGKQTGGGWFGWLAGAVVAGAVALAVILLPQTDAPGFAADLVAEQGVLRVEARLDGRDMEVALAEGAPADDRDFELWWIADQDATPVSLGVLPRDGRASMTLPEGLEPGDTVQLAVSDEPLGGSPTGVHGPVLAIGPLTRL
ncbi:anti-sigma factor [Paracoccus tegillarcae]|uniref:Anti-sigma K factor RskA C-terminal domain-containing protein n=1 Tax=Paracoccus tegillarcae TaxID=1529068 RepID=A0A2K9EG92_9RHOB|nr:anti-sigma factor [Paracoccus tegillarcae]AUH33359.1 hypothetical protein CUV01_08110 [Paracoccus tegillarcae]